MTSQFDPERFNALPIIGILRGFDANATARLIEAARDGGIANIEITMNTPGAAALIRTATGAHGRHMNIGAGTVTSVPLLDEALAAGAGFIVTPALNSAVVSECRRRNVPVFPGAFTPTEILAAWELGASMVKVFPAEVAGSAWLRSVKAPLPSVKLLPTGGVDLATLPEFLAAGADGAGVGSPLFAPALVKAGDWSAIHERCTAFRECWLQHKPTAHGPALRPPGRRGPDMT